MPEFFQLELSEQEILIIIDQLYMNMLLDYKQHSMLPIEMQEEDVEEYMKRQKTRYSVLLKALDVLQLPAQNLVGLEDVINQLEVDI